MIKVIKERTRKQIECTTCGCLFTYDEEDTKISTISNNRKPIICPQCNKEIILEAVR